MSDHDDTQPDARVYNFPQIGFRLAPATTPDNTPPYPDRPPVVPSPDDGQTTPAPSGRRVRRSPLDTLNALPDPGLTTPLLPVPVPQPGYVPDTFRIDPTSGPAHTGPRLGALSLAACLAVAVAALRGTHTVLSTWRERRLARDAETADLRKARIKAQAAMIEAGAKRAKKVPSSPEFGRKALGNRSGSGGSSSGRGSGGGAGRSGSGSGAGGKKPSGGGLFGKGGGSQASRTNGAGPKARHRKSPLGGTRKKANGAGGSGGAGGRGTKNNGLGGALKPKGPRRNSQDGTKPVLDKQRRKQLGPGRKANGSGSGGTGLGAALKKDTQKAAARRWKKRQKNGGPTPALWGNKTPNNPKTPKKGPLGKGQQAGGNGAAKNTPGANSPKANKAQTPGAGRRNLNQALWHDWKKAAGRRWKKRQHQRKAGHVPPIWKARGHKKNGVGPAGAGFPGGTPKANTPKTPKVNLNKNRQRANKQQQRWAGRWQRAQAWARKKAARGGCFPGGTPGAAGQAAPGTPGAAGGQRGPGAYAGPAGAGFPGGQRKRRSPFQNAGQAAAQTQGTTYTFDRPDQTTPAASTAPAALSRGIPALDAAPTTTPPRPGTTRPKEPIPMPPASAPVPAAKPDPRITKAKKQAARAAVNTVGRKMDARHETEITLDDACDTADQLMADAFKTHDQSSKLAGHARSLRDAWLVLAEDCAVNSNLTGTLYTAASIKFAESMELLARMTDEMRTSSLEATEMSETAGNELNDAYRPISQATADAGLSTPSAPVHNEV